MESLEFLNDEDLKNLSQRNEELEKIFSEMDILYNKIRNYEFNSKEEFESAKVEYNKLREKADSFGGAVLDGDVNHIVAPD